jgi:hypothetical protein
LIALMALMLGAVTPASVRAAAPVTSPAPACTQEPDPAADLERTFREALRAYGTRDAPDAGRPHEELSHFAAREAERILAPHADLVRRHARWALERLPRERLPDMSGWPHIPMRAPSDADLAETAAELPLGGLELALFRNPAWAFDTVRIIAATDPSAQARLIRVRELEGLAPPRLVWANDDVERPVLALVKRGEILEVDFALDRAGASYLPKRVVWAKRPALAPPAKPGPDPADAALRAFTDAMEGYDVDGSKDGPHEFTVNARLFAVERGQQLLAGKAEVLHQRTRCDLLKRPRATLPDMKSWQVIPYREPSDSRPASALAILPLLKWQPARYFMSIRQTARWSVEGVSLRKLTPLDEMAPPVVVRTNDDPDNPTLAVIDRDEVFTVAFRYDPSLPGYVPGDLKWLRRSTR